MRKKLAAGLGTLALTITAVTVPALSSAAQDQPPNDPLDYFTRGDVYSRTLDWECESDDPQAIAELQRVESDGTKTAVDPDLYTLDIDGDQTTVTSFDLDRSQLPSGEYSVFIPCENLQRAFTFAFSRLVIEKAVDGTAPADSEFTFSVDVTRFGVDGDDNQTTQPGYSEFELTFPADGGQQLYYIDLFRPTELQFDVEEIEDGGADSVEGNNASAHFDYAAPDKTLAITNTFDAAPDPGDGNGEDGDDQDGTDADGNGEDGADADGTDQDGATQSGDDSSGRSDDSLQKPEPAKPVIRNATYTG